MLRKVTSLFFIAAAATLAAAQDNHESCAFWAENGECDANPGYMLVNCKTSCDRVAAEVTYYLMSYFQLFKAK